MSQPKVESSAIAALLGRSSTVFAHGFSWRKRAILRKFVDPYAVRFVSSAENLPVGATLLLWGGVASPSGLRSDIRIVRVEDGFLRSVGLGAALIQPLSWVLDGSGMHYDSTRPSDLEQLLARHEFSLVLTDRARALRTRIVESGITKYSVGQNAWTAPAHPSVILVPGQVETDVSLRLGAPGIRTNMALLQAVRAARPESYVLYKPHPDVTAGLRARGVNEKAALSWCDEIVTDVPMGELLKQVSEVHVLTSLAGFEALLRGKPVTCYGQPFYAGWGLTTDMQPLPRRQRHLTLDELVAGALILYPRYVSRSSADHSTPERVLEELVHWRANTRARSPVWTQLWQRLIAHTVAQP
jgi:capsular polysaccharide export protein